MGIYLSIFPGEKNRLQILRTQLDSNADVSTRKNLYGHVTASALVLNRKNEVVLIYHKQLQKWIPPGGHHEAGEKVWESASREAEEETGLKALKLHAWHEQNDMSPIDIDTHSIPNVPQKAEPEHFHFNFQYLMHADEEQLHMDESEVSGAKWFSLKEARALDNREVWDKVERVINGQNVMS